MTGKVNVWFRLCGRLKLVFCRDTNSFLASVVYWLRYSFGLLGRTKHGQGSCSWGQGQCQGEGQG